MLPGQSYDGWAWQRESMRLARLGPAKREDSIMTEDEYARSTLEDRIVHLAHIADKNLAVSGGQCESLRRQWAGPLGRLLAQWADEGFASNSRIDWAQQVLRELETGVGLDSEASADEAAGDIMSLIRTRRSVRTWTEAPVDGGILELILEAARWAPSSGNRQAVRLVVLQSPECKEAVVRLKEAFLGRAPLVILVGLDLRVYSSEEIWGGLPLLDAAAAIENMLLVAHAHGLGCCWSKFTADDWQEHPEMYFEAKRKLKLPGSFRPASLIAVGHPARPTRTPPRKEIEEFVRYDDAGFGPDDFPDWRPSRARKVCKVIRQMKSRWVRRIKKRLPSRGHSAGTHRC